MDELTFFEAMAAVGRNEADRVEVWIGALHKWTSLKLQVDEDTPLSVFRHPSCKFRRAQPKRSRAKEMGAENIEQRSHWDEAAWIAHGIYTVCEWLRTDCKHGEDSSTEYAKAIEREFLEPR